ncbi:MAG: hypothetical protein AAF234_19995 [Pseudomonadota bacterium]
MLTTKTTLLATASVLLIASLMQPAWADARSAPRVVLPAQASQSHQVRSPTVNVDESALYYYAQNNQHGRVEAEVRRLQTMHPYWTPPSDLYHGGAYNRDQQLWDMFAAQEISEIHEEVARRVAAEPGWQPPLELMEALERSEHRHQLVENFNAGNTGQIISAVEDDPSLLAADDLEVLWIAGGAYAREEQHDIAVQMFDIALRAVHSPDELSGTLYNARDALPSAHVQPLFATAEAHHGSQAAYANVMAQFALDLQRDQLGADLEAWRIDPDRAHALDQEAMVAIEANWQAGASLYASDADLAGDYELVGWAYYAQGNHRQALALFQRALASADVLHANTAARYGAALAMRDDGDIDGALNVLAEGLPETASSQTHVLASRNTGHTPHTDDRSMALYIELLSNALYGLENAVTLSPQRVARHTRYVGVLESASGAEALGWYAYRSGQLTPASAWFAKSLEWQPSQSAVEGLVRSTWRQGEQDDARAHLASYTAAFPDVASLGDELAAQRTASTATTSAAAPARPSAVAAASQAQRSGNPRRCLSLLQGARSTHEASLVRAWCLLDLGRSHEAATSFATAQTSGSGRIAQDAGYGHALAMLRQGRTFDALAIARDVELSEEQRGIIARSALADQANQAFNAGHFGDAIAALDRRTRFAPETRDLTLLRAWALVRLNAPQQARQLFEALDRQLSTRETQSGLAAVPSPNAAWMAN